VVSGLFDMANAGIALRLRAGPAGDARAELLRSRSGRVARAFRGLTPRELQARLPMVFSVCKESQAAACSAAVAAAQGAGMTGGLQRRHALAVAAETLFEAVRALALTWPGMLGILPNPPVAAVRGRLSALLAALAADAGDGEVASAMTDYAAACRDATFGADSALPQNMDALAAWAGRHGSVAATFFNVVLDQGWAGLGRAELDFVEEAPLATLLAHLTGPEGEAFAAAPHIDGRPGETGSLARRRSHPLVTSTYAAYGPTVITRLAARLAEAGDLIESFRHGQPEVIRSHPAPQCLSTAEGWGAGIVHSARGVLIHALRLDGGKVTDFRILAPTEWNFRVGGAALQALESLGRSEQFRGLADQHRLAALVAGACDPCVPCEVAIERPEAAHA